MVFEMFEFLQVSASFISFLIFSSIIFHNFMIPDQKVESHKLKAAVAACQGFPRCLAFGAYLGIDHTRQVQGLTRW